MGAERHANPEILRTMLCAAVPLWMEYYISWPGPDLQAEAQRLADQVAHSSALIIKTPTTKKHPEEGTAAAFNATARSIAIGAYLPGGVNLYGLHWCVARQHHGVPGFTWCHQPVTNVTVPGGEL